MTIKDIKLFLEQFNDSEEIADIEFERTMDICNRCGGYYYNMHHNNNCAKVDECSCKKHKDTSYLRIAFKSDIDEDGAIYYNKYRELCTVDSE